MDSKIEIEFSEPLDESSILAAIFISPPHEDHNIRLKGRRLVISPEGGIPADRAMTVTIGTGVKDVHGVPLAQSMTIAFTAGEHIEGGTIRGRIYAEEPVGGMVVGAWPGVDPIPMMPDSIVAPFLTQSGSDGSFALPFMPPGQYRLACWDDKNRNRRYHAGVDRLGICSRDLLLEKDSLATIDFFALKRDTTDLAPLMLFATDKHHLQLRFSRPPRDWNRLEWPPQLGVVDSVGDGLELWASWPDPVDSSRCIYLTESMRSGMSYSAMLNDDTTRFDFTGPETADSVGPSVVRTAPEDNAREIEMDAAGWIAFNDKLSGDSLLTALSMTVQDSIPTRLILENRSPNKIDWRVASPLPAGARCLLTLDLTKVQDVLGNIAGDTVKTFFFTTMDPAGNGEISGRIDAETSHKIEVQAIRTGSRSTRRQVTSDGSDNSFIIRNLVPGDYALWCWEDVNGNQKYDPGDLAPFRHAERFSFLQDTITVRARWESGGVNFVLP